MRFLIDTNVLSEAGKKHPNPKVLNWLLSHEASSRVPAVVLAERYKGAHIAAHTQRDKLLAELDTLIAEAPERILPFDLKAAKIWGEYTSSLRQRPKSYPDTQIAAIALANNLIVVTRNTKDFPGVDTINPFED